MSNTGNLNKIYDLYVVFTRQLGTDRGRDYPVRDSAAFEKWWLGLGPKLRTTYEQHFRQGYSNVVANGQRQIKETLAARMLGD